MYVCVLFLPFSLSPFLPSTHLFSVVRLQVAESSRFKRHQILPSPSPLCVCVCVCVCVCLSVCLSVCVRARACACVHSAATLEDTMHAHVDNLYARTHTTTDELRRACVCAHPFLGYKIVIKIYFKMSRIF